MQIGSPGIIDNNIITIGGSRPGVQIYRPRNNYSDYAFKCDFIPGITSRDKVSKQVMLTDLDTNRVLDVNGEYTVFPADAPTVNENGLNTYGAYTNLCKYSDDTDSWTGSGPWTQSINLASIGVYTISTDVLGATVTVMAGTATIDGEASATYGVPDQFEVTGVGTVTISTDVVDPKVQLTKSLYRLPYVKTESTTVSVPQNYSDADEGYKWPIEGDLLDALDGIADGDLLNTGNLESAKYYEIISTEIDHFGSGKIVGDRVTGLTTALDINNTVKEISPAKGEMQIEWMPMFDYDNIMAANKNIVALTNYANKFIYVYDDDFFIKNGINSTHIYNIPYQTKTKYTIRAIWGTHPTEGANKMQLIITDGTTTWESSVADFDGSFDPEDFLKIAYGNGYWQAIKSIKILKEPTW